MSTKIGSSPPESNSVNNPNIGQPATPPSPVVAQQPAAAARTDQFFASTSFSGFILNSPKLSLEARKQLSQAVTDRFSGKSTA